MNIRRTLDELSALYRLEPNLKDLFVEGYSDKVFIEWYLRDITPHSVSVYPIDLVDVPDEVLTKHGLSTGNRSRLLALSCELTENFQCRLKILCVVDRDFEDYRPTIAYNSYVIFTDCNSLELYAFTPKTMEKFAAVALGGFRMPVPDLMAVLTGVLEQVYSVRLANELLVWGMEWIPFTRYVDIKGTRVSFRKEDFLRAYLQKNNKWSKRVEFLDKVNEVLGLLSEDPGRKIRGHDLVELLMHVIRQSRCNRGFSDEPTLAGSLMATLERIDLEGSPLFQRMRALVAG